MISRRFLALLRRPFHVVCLGVTRHSRPRILIRTILRVSTNRAGGLTAPEYASEATAWLEGNAGLEHVHPEPCANRSRMRLFRGRHRTLPRDVRGLGGWHATNPALERDRPSHGGLDRAAISDDRRGRPAAPIRDSRPRHDLFGGRRCDTRRDALDGSRNTGPRPAAGPSTVTAATPAPGQSGPLALELAVSFMERLANRARHCEAGDRHCVASPGLPPVLDVEESPTHRPTARAAGRPHTHSHHVAGQLAVGCPADSRR